MQSELLAVLLNKLPINIFNSNALNIKFLLKNVHKKAADYFKK